MRHRKAGRTLGRSSAHRQSLTRNQITSLLRYGRIKTTEAKASELQRWVDRVITSAKPNDLSARRHVSLYVNDRDVVNKLFTTYCPRYQNRQGGYTRSYHIGPRHGDGAPVMIVEMVDE